ncbi:UNVERIFIED_CONTAM: hypothetical protein RMT77_017657 [Armadillidium vulgare]
MPSHQLSSSALLPDTPDRDSLRGSRMNIGGSRSNISISRLNMNDSLVQGPPPPPSIWDCLVSCHSRMGQRLARKRVEQGVRLYNQQKHLAAVKKWRQALRRIQKDNDRFVTLGYLAQAHMDWGRYRELLDYGFQQLDIANELDSPMLRAEAYLTLAKGNERLGNLEKALTYCRHSLYNQCDQSRVTGNVHYTLGNIYTTFSAFCKALEHYELALKVSRVIHDISLELQVYCGLSFLFCYLQDFEKALSFGAKAFELSKTFIVLELNSKYQRMAFICLSTPLRKLSRIHEARDCCQDALKLSLAANDHPSYARCLLILADIHRQCLDVQRAYKHYEACMNLMTKMEDKYGQLLALNGIAKVLGVMRRQSRICDCRPLEINNKVVDAASSIGCKLIMRSSHNRLADLYRILRDDENERLQTRLADCLTEEMELVCGVCRDPIADTPGNSIDALPCSHIFHNKCVRDLIGSGDRKKRKRICPDCRKSLNSRMMLICYDELKAAYGENTAGGGLGNVSSLNLIPPSSSTYGHFRSASPSEDEQQL